jgi:excisionase family DNA binding protein
MSTAVDHWPQTISKMSRRPPFSSNSTKTKDGQRLERLLTVDQLAELWQVSSRTVRRMVADGRLPVVRIGRAVRIPAKAVAL